MTRLEENGMLVEEVAKSAEAQPTGTYEEKVTFRLSLIATMLTDISKSLQSLRIKQKGMSEWIKCDRCNKITKADSSGDKRYKIGVDGFDGYSTFHLCEWCLRSFYLDYLEWKWNDNESQYVPPEESEERAKE